MIQYVTNMCYYSEILKIKENTHNSLKILPAKRQ